MVGAVAARSWAPRRVAPAVVGCLALIGTLLGAGAPAFAADAPVVGNLKTFTTGHVTGTVTTTSPYVRVRLGTSQIASGALPVTDGAANFNLTTWGFGFTTVTAVGCSGTDPADCDTPTGESARFLARDPIASFNLNPARTVANGQRPYVVVNDALGGGVLRILWVPDDPTARTAQQDVNRSGSTYLDFLASTDSDGDGVGDSTQVDDGTGRLVLWRCAGPADPNQCRVQSNNSDGSNPMSVAVEVDHSVWATGSVTPHVIGAYPTTLGLPITVSDAGSYHLAWKVVQAENQNVAVASGSQDFVVDGTTADVSVPVNQLDAGTYVVLADLTRHSTFGAAFASRVTSTRGGTPPTFEVDQTAPDGVRLTSTQQDLFPAPDGYLDSVGFALTAQHEAWTDVQLEVQRDSDFAIVHTEQVGDVTPSPGDAGSADGGTVAFTPWDGRDDTSGAVVPAGSYTTIASLHDTFGNVTRIRGTVWVDSRRLVAHTWHRTMTARTNSAVKVGSCSVVRHPSSHRWAYSVTMASGSAAHCRAKTAASRAITLTYASSVPVVPATLDTAHGTELRNPGGYGAVALRAYGGASLARKKQHSVATMRWLDATGRLGVARRLTSALGWHASPTRTATGLVRRDQTLRWTTATAGTNAYDVRNYELTLAYTTLQ